MEGLDDLLNVNDDSPAPSPAPADKDVEELSDRAADSDHDAPDLNPSQLEEAQPVPSTPPAPPEIDNPDIARHAQQNQKCLELMTERQLDRYAAFRRSKLNQKGLRRLVATATGKAMNPDAAIVLAGVAKMHVGEMVERARELAEQRGNYGPLHPQDVRTAFSEWYQTKGSPNKHHRRRY